MKPRTQNHSRQQRKSLQPLLPAGAASVNVLHAFSLTGSICKSKLLLVLLSSLIISGVYRML